MISTIQDNAKRILQKPQSKTKKTFVWIFFIFLILCFARVPYLTTYIDATIFDYLMGGTKYMFYSWWIFACFSLICKFRFTPLFFTKRVWIANFIFMIASMVGISIVSRMIGIIPEDSNFLHILSTYNADIFSPYLNSVMYDGFINAKVSGGFIGEFLTAALTTGAEIFGLVIAVLAVLIGFMVISNRTKFNFLSKLRLMIIRSLGGSLEQQPSNAITGKEIEATIQKPAIITSKFENEEIYKKQKNLQLYLSTIGVNAKPIKFKTNGTNVQLVFELIFQDQHEIVKQHKLEIIKILEVSQIEIKSDNNQLLVMF